MKRSMILSVLSGVALSAITTVALAVQPPSTAAAQPASGRPLVQTTLPGQNGQPAQYAQQTSTRQFGERAAAAQPASGAPLVQTTLPGQNGQPAQYAQQTSTRQFGERAAAAQPASGAPLVQTTLPGQNGQPAQYAQQTSTRQFGERAAAAPAAQAAVLKLTPPASGPTNVSKNVWAVYRQDNSTDKLNGVNNGRPLPRRQEHQVELDELSAIPHNGETVGLLIGKEGKPYQVGGIVENGTETPTALPLPALQKQPLIGGG